jgi:hypothetical protein
MRPHAGTGSGSPGFITTSFAKLREEASNAKRVFPKSEPPPPGHDMGEPGKGRPMEVHPPRHKDMDPNHPRNLKKMKPKVEKVADVYQPYPLPEGNLLQSPLIISETNH